MLYLKLFWSFFQIGLFSIGGGYASLPLIQHQVVSVNKWLTMSEYTDLITISGMTPGPIAINSSTFVGIQVGGPLGAVIATLGCIMPSCLIVITLGYFYKKFKNMTIVQGILSGLRPTVVALVASAGLSILSLAFWGENKGSLKPANLDKTVIILFFVCLLIIRKWKKVNPIFIMAGSGLAGFILYLVQGF